MAGRVWVGVIATGAIALAAGAMVGGNLGAAAATATYEPQVLAAEQDTSAALAEAEEARQEKSDIIAESNRVSDENAATLAEQQKQLDETIAARDDYRANLLLALDERDAAIADADRGWALYDEAYDTGLYVDELRIATVRALLDLIDRYNGLVDESNTMALFGRLLLAQNQDLTERNQTLTTQRDQYASAVVQIVVLFCLVRDAYVAGGGDVDRSLCEIAGIPYDDRLADDNPIIGARDAAIADRDAAIIERDDALAQRDAAILERDEARDARDEAREERDEAREERDAALADADAVLQAENDALRAQVAALLAERDGLAGEKTQLLTGLDTCRDDLGFAQSAAANLYDAIELLLAGDIDGADGALDRAFAAAGSVSGTC